MIEPIYQTSVPEGFPLTLEEIVAAFNGTSFDNTDFWQMESPEDEFRASPSMLVAAVSSAGVRNFIENREAGGKMTDFRISGPSGPMGKAMLKLSEALGFGVNANGHPMEYMDALADRGLRVLDPLRQYLPWAHPMALANSPRPNAPPGTNHIDLMGLFVVSLFILTFII